MNPGVVSTGFTDATDPNMKGAGVELVGAMTVSCLPNIKGCVAVGVVDGREPKENGAGVVVTGRGVLSREAMDSPKDI